MSDRQELAEWWETFDGPAYPAGDEVADAILASDWLRQVKAEAATIRPWQNQAEYDEWIEQLCALIPDGDEAEYSNPEGAVESIILDCFTEYRRQLRSSYPAPDLNPGGGDSSSREPLDLDAIEARERVAWSEPDGVDLNRDMDVLRASVNDVAPLIAEVRRLRQQRDHLDQLYREECRTRGVYMGRFDRLAETVARVEELAAKDYPPPPPDERGAAGWRFAMEHVRAALDEKGASNGE